MALSRKFHGRRRLQVGCPLAALTLLSVLALVASQVVWRAGDDRVYDNLAKIPSSRVGLVLGCPPKVANGVPNLYFQRRVRAAARLFHAGKVEYLLLSGDNSEASYNEPQAMMDALLERGVPLDRLVLDYAGFRTLDSIVRAKEVFGLDRVVIVSQEFHNRRALFLARRSGIEATGYNAVDIERSLTAKMRWREFAARVKAFADIYILGTEAKFLGDPIEIGAEGES